MVTYGLSAQSISLVTGGGGYQPGNATERM
jgi:hypothetical protein